jgi:hypothetical protein
MAVGSCAKRRFAENDRRGEETPSPSGSFSERLLVWICDRNACAVAIITRRTPPLRDQGFLSQSQVIRALA